MTIEQLDRAQAPAHNVGRTAAWLTKHVELCVGTVDLSLSQYRLLSLLDEGSAVSSALAERLSVRPPSVTAVMDGLVSRGLVARHHTEDDRRRVSHELTDEGRRVLDEADRLVAERIDKLAEYIPSAKARRVALESLALWNQAMVAHRNELAGRTRGQ